MTTFRIRRYLIALLWSWSMPFLIGASLGGLYISHAHIEILEANDDLFLRSFEAVIDRCTVATASAPSDLANDADAEQVKGRAPGSSDHASPIRRTEARAERTLDPARTETASARECGECFSPRAPEPSAARVG